MNSSIGTNAYLLFTVATHLSALNFKFALAKSSAHRSIICCIQNIDSYNKTKSFVDSTVVTKPPSISISDNLHKVAAITAILYSLLDFEMYPKVARRP